MEKSHLACEKIWYYKNLKILMDTQKSIQGDPGACGH
jgi:hypothetical protein